MSTEGVEIPGDDVTIIEAVRRAEDVDEVSEPSVWRVRLIKAGLSANGNNYPLAVLHEAASLYEGVRALSRNDDEHLAGKGKNARNVVGWFTGVIPTAEGLDANFNVSASAPWLKTMLWDAWGRGKKNIIGFSHVAEATAARGARGARDVLKIAKVEFVDVVVTPSAGGEIVGLAEAANTGEREDTMIQNLLKLIEALDPVRFRALDTATITEAEAMKVIEDITAAKTKETAATVAENVDTAAAVGQISEALKGLRSDLTSFAESTKNQIGRERSVLLCESAFAASGLPAEAYPRVLERVNATAAPASKIEIEDIIAAEAKYLGVRQGWNGPGSTRPVRAARVMRDVSDKWKASLDGLVSGEAFVKLSEAQGDVVPAYERLSDAFRDGTGLSAIDGGLTSPLVGVAEAAIASTTFGGALGDSIRRVMQTEYRLDPHQSWRNVFTTANVPDFRKQYRPQTGTFPTLATVSQSAAYLEFTNHLGEFTPEYTVTKYGNLQALTMETIVNDDIGFVRRIPIELGRAASRTVDYNAWNTLWANTALTYHLGGGTTDVSTTYAGPFSATTTMRGPNGNLGTSPLSAAAISATRLAMLKNTSVISATGGVGGPITGIPPRFLCVPYDLDQTAFELTGGQYQPTVSNNAAPTSNDNTMRPNFLNQRANLTTVIMTQASDATDWYMLSDPKDLPTVEVGFLGGRQEPELLIADQPTSDAVGISGGSMFSADRVVYKVRLIFGTVVLDYRGMYRHTVA